MCVHAWFHAFSMFSRYEFKLQSLGQFVAEYVVGYAGERSSLVQRFEDVQA